MKTILRTTFGTTVAAIALAGCDAPPPADPVAPSVADSMQAAEIGSDLSYEALVALIGDPDDFARARKLGTLLPSLGPEALPRVKQALEDAAVLEMGAVEFELLLRYWATREPAGAAFYALGASPRGYRTAAIYAAITPWAKADPQKALETVGAFALQEGDVGTAAQIALVRGWYESEQPGLEEYIRDIGAGFERQRALGAYATAMVRKHGVDALVRWAEAVPEDDATYKLEVYRNAATALVPFDLEAAQRFCDAHCDGPHGANMRGRIAIRWALDDGPAALEWLATAPEGQEKRHAVRLTYAAWSREDREAALRWMAAKTVGEPAAWLKPTFGIYARLLAEDSPAEGLAWAERIEADREFVVVTVEIARGWRAKDEAAAEAWLRQSSLPDDVLEKIRAAKPMRIQGKSFQRKRPS